MRYFKCFPIILLAVTLSYSNDPEQSIAPPGMIYELLALNKDLPTAARPKYLSPCDIVASSDGKQLYVAEQTAKQVAVVDIATKTVATTIKLPNEPTGIAVAPSGLLYVTCSSDIWPDGMVCEVNPVQGKVLRRLPAGHGACSPVISPVELTLFVCNVYDNDVSVIDIGGAKEIKRIKTVREPRCAAITPDGATLVVGNALPDQAATDTLSIACKITLINALTRERTTDIALQTGSNNVSGIAVSPDGNYAFVTHLISMFAVPATQIDGGHIHTNNLAIVDIKGKKIINDVTLDSPMQGSGNPWGVACSQDGKILCVVHAGSNELAIIDMQQLIRIADTIEYVPDLPPQKKNLSHNLSALNDIMDKIGVSGKSPRAIAVIGGKAYTAGYYSDSLEIFDLHLPDSGSAEVSTASGSIALGPAVPSTSERKGESAFLDASRCFQHWQTCHSCHPFARADGLNWSLRVTIGAPKNSKSMLYSWWTPPTAWIGGHYDAYSSIRSGMNNQLFLEPDMAVASCVDTMFMKLKPVPSPHLVKGKLSAAAVRGREVYSSSNGICFKCHPRPLYTDLKGHNAGIEDPFDNNINWDTPSITECWRTAPYGHLGSKLTIKEMIAIPGMSWNPPRLTQDELNDLVEFVLSL